MSTGRRLITLVLMLSIIGNFIPMGFVHADEISDLQSKIEARNTDIEKLEKEIVGYQKQLKDIGSEVSSLSNTVKSLELNQKKLEADIAVSQNKIANKNLEIQQLSDQISQKEGTIEDDLRIIRQSLVTISQAESRSVVETFLSSESFSDAWGSLDSLASLQKAVYDRINSLRQAKAGLESNKTATETARAELLSLNDQLNDQRKIVLSTVNAKNALLKQTKSSESSYKKLLSTKQAQKDAFEKDVLKYESQLKLAVDATKLPHTGTGVLSWPLNSITITQYFGNTPFSTANPQVYNGKGHTGVDFAATIGTPVKSALGGIISGVGNTDILPTCYSYGKWVMVQHDNGLSTLYAHLSLQNVTTGQRVTTGQLLGYSGNTGYTTGPHLHFGVYATEGVQIAKFANSVNCHNVLIPLADFKAYLNPLSYL